MNKLILAITLLMLGCMPSAPNIEKPRTLRGVNLETKELLFRLEGVEYAHFFYQSAHIEVVFMDGTKAHIYPKNALVKWEY